MISLLDNANINKEIKINEYETYIEQDFTIAIRQITRGETPVKHKVFAAIIEWIDRSTINLFICLFFRN